MYDFLLVAIVNIAPLPPLGLTVSEFQPTENNIIKLHRNLRKLPVKIWRKYGAACPRSRFQEKYVNKH